MSKDYVTQIDGAYRIIGTRVWHDSVVYVFLQGQTDVGWVPTHPTSTVSHKFVSSL
jgi:hypothetical protein